MGLGERAARRLAWRAAYGEPGGWRTRRALRRLDRALEGADPAAIVAGWRVWLERPGAELGEVLFRRGWSGGGGTVGELSRVALGELPPASAAAFGPTLAAALALGDHPVARAARDLLLSGADRPPADAVCAAALADGSGTIARFCAGSGLVPGDPVRRAVFLLLTDQYDRYRDADPDGRLLATGYARAGAGERARLRDAASRADAVEAVVGVLRERAVARGPDEVAYLAGRLAAGREWTELWGLVGEVSPAQAVELVRAFPAGWRPGDAAGGSLFDVLAAGYAEAAPYAPQYRLPAPRRPLNVAFAPGGSEVAVVGHASTARDRDRHLLAVHGLPDGERRWQRTWQARWGRWTRAAFLDDGSVVVTGTPPLVHGPARRRRGEPGRAHGWSAGELVAPYAGGVAALSWDGLRLVSFTGPERLHQVRELSGELPGLAVDPGSGRFAAHSLYGATGEFERDIMLFSADGELVASLPARDAPDAGEFTHLEFAGPDRLVSAHRTRRAGALATGRLVLWRRDGDTLAPEATTPTDGEVRTLVAYPAIGRVTAHDGTLRTFTVPGLAPAPPPAGGDGWPGPVWRSPDGEWVAAPAGHPGDGLDLYRLAMPPWAAGLLDRPMAATGPADLASATAATGAERPPPGTAAAVVLACLEYQRRVWTSR
jgi:hypothetical protein